ncbi:MAG: OPT/YSL family transporter [Oligoflexales bacterium]|nr:OPT/YSL family transporter [Oligoflexales bacterium]
MTYFDNDNIEKVSGSRESSAGEVDLKWYMEVYQGDDMPQLTLRAVLMGGVLGGIMSLSNLYIGLKTGWALGVAITACILSYTIYKTLMGIFPGIFKTEMSILENNCMQSTATSAGYSTCTSMVSAIPAYLIITGNQMPWQTLALWTFFLGSLGVFLAIPMKRQMINIEQLKFPTGIAAAETLRSLHSKKGDGQPIRKAKALGLSGVIGILLAWSRDAFQFISSALVIPGTITGYPLSSLTISIETSTIMYAAGAIIGWKMGWSLLLGATVNFGILAPMMANIGAIDASKLGFRTILGWSTWTGASIMVTSGLVAFFMHWEMITRAIRSFHSKPGKIDENERLLKSIEVPTSWFIVGTAFSGLGCIFVLYYAFQTSVLMGIASVFLAFFLALVACRVTGEADITPIGAMGKITQLTFGILAPTKIITNLMTAAVTAGAAGTSADLLTDLKSGYLLGANPRKQFIAQYIGIFFGSIIVVPVFYLLIPDASALGTDKWPAPAAQVWAAVARLLQAGFGALHPTARTGILVGSILGILLQLSDRILPRKYCKYVPSPMGIGLSMVIPFFNSFSMFLGALLACLFARISPKRSEQYTVPIASGLIAGESISGIIIAVLFATGILI